MQTADISNQGRPRQSKVPLFLMPSGDLQLSNGCRPIGHHVPWWHSHWSTISMTDEKSAPASAGLTDQVALSLPSQPSFPRKVNERPG
jgi:hypothetical protein